ncbi:hypothetical protein PG994_011745 [Apiospora phragmitis]|uniref:Uncharacterized protein n=1 Tax=Apiospora phragmitis TaxID=2905665 RepID=A0ABR1TVX0_9PEZI
MDVTPGDSVSNGELERLTDEIRPPPFPFNLESTWFLATVWLLLGATNLYVQHRLESYFGLGPILLNTIATSICAAATAISYDGVLTFVNEHRVWATRDVELTLASLVAWHWRIAINEDATLEDQKEALMQDGTLQVPRTVFGIASELVTWAVDLIAAVLTAASWTLPAHIIMPFTDQDVHKWTGHVDALESLAHEKSGTLFSPAFGRSWSSAGQLGAQVGLQLGLAALCFVAVLTFHYLCQEQIIRTKGEVERGELDFRNVGEDERWLAAFWRAIALHLISFTAYQIFGAIVSAFELEPLLSLKAPPTLSSWVAQRSRMRLAEAACWAGFRGLAAMVIGLGIYVIHCVLRQIVWLLIRVLASMVVFEDTVLWSSSLTQATVVEWKGHVLGIAGFDFKLKDKVLLAQGLMNCLFDIRAPLIIMPPNNGILAFDSEVWAG